MQAVLIIRVSDPKQEKEGLSLDNQEEALRQYTLGLGFEIAREFRFQESADQKIRKKFDDVIAQMKRHKDWKALIGYRVDRMTRNFRDHVSLDELRLTYDKELHFVYDRLVIGKNTIGREIQDWDTKVYLAKQHLNRLKEDAVVTARYKLERGEWPGKAPYGYRNRKNEQGRSWIFPEAFEAKIVSSILTWYASGACSMLMIRRKLKQNFGVNFSIGKIDHILNNRFYGGQMRYCARLYPHAYEPLVTPDVFDKIEARKTRYNKQPSKLIGLPFPYRATIVCDTCGCAVTAERKQKPSGLAFHYYHCTQYRYKHNAAWLTEQDLTEQFASPLEHLEIPEDALDHIVSSLRSEHRGHYEFTDTLTKRLQVERQRQESRMKAAYDDKLDGIITPEFFEQKRQEILERQKDIDTQLAELEKRTADEYYLTAADLLELASKAGKLFRVAKAEEKRELVKHVFQNCRLKEKRLLWELKKPFDTVLFHATRQTWRPLLDAFRNREVDLGDNSRSSVTELLRRCKASEV